MRSFFTLCMFPYDTLNKNNSHLFIYGILKLKKDFFFVFTFNLNLFIFLVIGMSSTRGFSGFFYFPLL